MSDLQQRLAHIQRGVLRSVTSNVTSHGGIASALEIGRPSC